MAGKDDSVKDWTFRATKVLPLGKDGINRASVSNPVPVDAVVTVDSMSINAELNEASGHDYYVTTSNTGNDAWKITFDSVSGLALEDIEKVENKTQGWIYNTKGATVANTSITLVEANQESGAPVCGASDEFEVVYRGDSRFTDKSQMVNITDGSNEIDVVNQGDAWEPGTTDLKGFGIYGYDSVNNIAKPLKLNATGELAVDAEITNEEMKTGSEDDTSTNAHYLRTDSAGKLIDVEVIQTTAADLNMTEANSGDILTAVELIDDSVYTDGTGTPSKGVAVMGTDGTNPQLMSVTSNGKLNIYDIDQTVTVDSTDLDIRDLSNATDSVEAHQGGTWDINDISGTISLPTGAATETTLSSLEGKDFATETSMTDGSQKSQVVDGSGNVISSTSNALDVHFKSGESTTVTNLNAVVAVTAGSSIDASSYNSFTVQYIATDVTNGGTIKLQGSLDDTNWYDIDEEAITKNGSTYYSVSYEKHKYIRANLTARTDGTYTAIIFLGN